MLFRFRRRKLNLTSAPSLHVTKRVRNSLVARCKGNFLFNNSDNMNNSLPHTDSKTTEDDEVESCLPSPQDEEDEDILNSSDESDDEEGEESDCEDDEDDDEEDEENDCEEEGDDDEEGEENDDNEEGNAEENEEEGGEVEAQGEQRRVDAENETTVGVVEAAAAPLNVAEVGHNVHNESLAEATSSSLPSLMAPPNAAFHTSASDVVPNTSSLFALAAVQPSSHNIVLPRAPSVKHEAALVSLAPLSADPARDRVSSGSVSCKDNVSGVKAGLWFSDFQLPSTQLERPKRSRELSIDVDELLRKFWRPVPRPL
jgi:hypothetical protein